MSDAIKVNANLANYVSDIITTFQRIVRDSKNARGGIVIKSNHPAEMSKDIIGELRMRVGKRIKVHYVSKSDFACVDPFVDGIYNGPFYTLSDDGNRSYLLFRVAE